MHILPMPTYSNTIMNSSNRHKTAKNMKFYNGKKNDKIKLSCVALEHPTNYKILYSPTI
jgi:hypothetical protein